MKYLLNLTIVLLLTSVSLAQTTSFEEHPAKESFVGGTAYCMIKFSSPLDHHERDLLASRGIELLDYYGESTYGALVTDLAVRQKAAGEKLIGFADFGLEMKMGRAMIQGGFPEHAESGGGRYEINVFVAPHLELEALADVLMDKGYSPIKTKHLNGSWSIVADPNDFESLASMPEVAFVDFKMPPPEAENYQGVNSHRINALHHHSIGYDGSGVVVAMGDDGWIGPHLDYQNRIDQRYVDYNQGDHGDHVAGTIMGAGNIDPKAEGMAPGSFLFSYPPYENIDSAYTHYYTHNVRVSSTSYSNGCNAGYTNYARQVDEWLNDRPGLMHVFSAGNSGTSNCGYGAGSSWGNVTGGNKVAKNCITVANLDDQDNINWSSSRGPAHDGRVKPEIAAVGTAVWSTVDVNSYDFKTGTSMSCPGVSGIYATLIEAYRDLNSGSDPENGLMRGILFNSADDQGNPHVDFIYGYGRANALKAFRIIESQSYLVDSIGHQQTNTHTINLPAGVDVGEVKVMISWIDPAASTSASKALINDLDMSVDYNGTSYLPWTLSSFPSNDSLSADAVRKEDHLNNQEQVTIENLNGGSLQVTVHGYDVGFGPQKYFITYYIEEKGIDITYPNNESHLLVNENDYVRFTTSGLSDPITVEYSADSGTTWTTIANSVSVEDDYVNILPEQPTANGMVRLTSGSYQATSDRFVVLGQPSGLRLNAACEDSWSLSWDPVPGATGYVVYRMGTTYMDSIGYSNSISTSLPVSQGDEASWWAVSAVIDGHEGMRSIAIEKEAGLVNCQLDNDLALVSVISPASGVVPACAFGPSMAVVVRVRNNGTNALNGFSLGYSFGQLYSAQQSFTHVLQPGEWRDVGFTATFPSPSVGTSGELVIEHISGDDYIGNDTLRVPIMMEQGALQTLPFVENFDNNSNCISQPNCGAGVCTIDSDWSNLQNGVGDDIDWRVRNWTTPSSGTGPSADHTQGNGAGKYLYLEASGECNEQEAILLSPCVDLDSAKASEFSFWYHMYGVAMGELHVDLLVDGAWVFDVIQPISGDQGNAWIQKRVNLSPYAGKTVAVRLRGITGSDYTSDIAIDDLSFGEVTTPPVANFTLDQSSTCSGHTVQLIDESSGASNWRWRISPSTYQFVQGTDSTTQNPMVRLLASGTYTIELEASNFYGSNTTTINNAVSIPNNFVLDLSNDFSSSINGTDGLWEVENEDSGITWQVTSAVESDGQQGQVARIRMYDYTQKGEKDYLVSEYIDLARVNQAIVTFDVAYAQRNSDSFDGLWIEVSRGCDGTFILSDYYKLGVDLSTAATSPNSWSPSSASDWRKDTLDLSPYSGEVIRVRFVGFNSNGNNLYLDNIRLIDQSTLSAKARVDDQVCINTLTLIDDLGSGQGVSYDWNFGLDANPATSTTVGDQLVSWTSTGQKVVDLQVSDGVSTEQAYDTLMVVDEPVGNFTATYNPTNGEVTFTSQVSNYQSIWWDFGDQSMGFGPDVTHTFDYIGGHEVTQYVQNACGVTAYKQWVAAEPASAQLQGPMDVEMRIYPNPARDAFLIEWRGFSKTVDLSITDLRGALLFHRQFDATQLQFGDQLPPGAYLIQLSDGQQSIQSKVIIL